MSPTSSRKRVPPSHVSTRPVLRWLAPVNAPFSWPKSSLSKSDSVIPLQSSGTKRPVERPLIPWMACARRSLPVPDSPRSSTGTSVGATRVASSSIRLNAGERPTNPSSLGRAEAILIGWMTSRKEVTAPEASGMGWVTTSSCCSPVGREVHVKRPARLTALAAPRDRAGLSRLVARGRVAVGHLVAVAAHHVGSTGELLAVGAVRRGDPVVRADDHRGPGQAVEDLREGNVPAIVPRAHQHPRRRPDVRQLAQADTNSRLIMPPMAVVERASFVTRLTGGRSNGCETELDNSLSCFALNAGTALAVARGRQPAPGT